MKTTSKSIGISRSVIATVLLSAFFSMNIFSQFSYSTTELASFRDEMISRSTPEITNLFHHLPLSDLLVIEERIEFEDWMLHPENWSVPESEISMVPVTFIEDDLNFEKWMFEINWIYDDMFTEEEIELEPWMSDLLQWSYQY